MPEKLWLQNMRGFKAGEKKIILFFRNDVYFLLLIIFPIFVKIRFFVPSASSVFSYSRIHDTNVGESSCIFSNC